MLYMPTLYEEKMRRKHPSIKRCIRKLKKRGIQQPCLIQGSYFSFTSDANEKCMAQ